MIDLVIPYTKNPDDGLELRFSLRSLERNLPQIRRVYVLGYKPSWITNVIHIPFNDIPGRKSYSIYRKLLHACSIGDLSDDFIYTTDDVYLLKPLGPGGFKYWYSGTLKDERDRARSGYRDILNASIELLGPNALNYDIHAPVIINKEAFGAANFGGWNKDVIIKSTYCSQANLMPDEYMEDLKFRSISTPQEIRAAINGRLFFSTDSYTLQINMPQVLRELFPGKSRFET